MFLEAEFITSKFPLWHPAIIYSLQTLAIQVIVSALMLNSGLLLSQNLTTQSSEQVTNRRSPIFKI